MTLEITALARSNVDAASTPTALPDCTKSKEKKVAKVVATVEIPGLSVASLPPLRSLTPVVSPLVASLISFRLQQNVLGELFPLLHDGRLSAFHGHTLSLLSSLSLNAPSETLEVPLQAWMERMLTTGGAVNWNMNALLVAMQSSVRSNGLRWSRRKLEKIYHLPSGAWYDAIQTAISARIKQGHYQRRRMLKKWRTTKLHKLSSMTSWRATDRSDKNSYMDLEKQQMEDWEMLDHEQPSLDDYCTCSAKRTMDLVCEVMHLIDSCERLGKVDWEGMIAVLERKANYDTGRGSHAMGDLDLVGPERSVAHDDWELVC